MSFTHSLLCSTIYQDIDLCSIEEFHAMTKTTDTTTTTNDTIIDIDKQIVDDQSTHHQLMLARLKHELSERMR